MKSKTMAGVILNHLYSFLFYCHNLSQIQCVFIHPHFLQKFMHRLHEFWSIIAWKISMIYYAKPFLKISPVGLSYKLLFIFNRILNKTGLEYPTTDTTCFTLAVKSNLFLSIPRSWSWASSTLAFSRLVYSHFP